jgi:branched-chain amino acid transport system substrate-binding protein
MKKALKLVLLAMVMLVAFSSIRAQDAMVIKIASQSPLSGPQATLGVGIRNAVELAIEQLGTPLTDMGYTLEYVPFDDQATAEVGVSNAQQIVADPEILGLIGHLNSGVAIPSSEVYDSNDLVMISPSNTNPLITDRALKTVNRVCGRDDLQGPTGAEYAAEIGVTTVYILHDTTAYGQGLAEFFRMRAEELGIEVLGFEGTEEQSQFDSLVQPVLALEPELIFFGGIYSQTGIFISQARAAGYEGLFMGGDGYDSSEYAALAGEAGVGTLYTSVAAPASAYPDAAQFITDYTAKFGEAPQPFGVQSYDATGILLAAIAEAAETAGGIPARADVAAAVRATTDYDGLSATITFDDNGDPQLGLYYVIEVTTADPAGWSDNEIIAQLELESPLYAMEMMMMEDGMMGTMEATAAP